MDIKVVNLSNNIKSDKFDEYEVLFFDKPIARVLVTTNKHVVIIPTQNRKMSTLWFTKKELLESILTAAVDDGYKRRILKLVAAYISRDCTVRCYPLAKVLEDADGKALETSVIGEVRIQFPSKRSPNDVPQVAVRVGEEVVDAMDYDPVTLIKKFMELKYRFYVPHEEILRLIREGKLEVE